MKAVTIRMIPILQPFRNDKNLGRAYNEQMQMVPDGCHVIIRDIDTLLLTPNTPNIIERYIQEYPDAVLTCYTNRVGPLAKRQLLNGTISDNTDINYHIAIAERMEVNTTVTPIIRCISGFLMVFSKELWKKYPFPETGKCLGVDSVWSKTLLSKGVQILRMNGVYCWHTYRLKNGINDKTHLQ